VRFGGLTAVQDVDCAVEEGQIFSIIGPNGAGKTTVFNAITGIYEPTSGTITLRGRTLERPFTWRVALAALVVGLATGMTAAVLSLDVNALWRATIKRNYAGPGSDFSYAEVWHDGIDYWNGTLAIDRVRGNRWALRTADGRRTLGYAPTEAEAEQLRARQETLVEAAAQGATLVEQDGRWLLRAPGSDEALATFENESDGQAVLEKYMDIAGDPAARRHTALVALLLATALGASGTLAVWSRARRTPEVIARAGIARTFQNIRLFHNMTVLENVLTAMDRQIRGGIVRMALRTPGIRRQEQAAQQRAAKLLDFIGLAGKESLLAKNLPYGDQRRLEIARALATEPQLILLDEPAAGMNPSESLELNDLIEQIRRGGRTVLLIEHHMKVVMGISDRIAVLEYGRKIAEGTPDQVRKDAKVIAAYLGTEEVS
jgi:ABC-type branched-subunit amino acid transport system ATPase component